MTRSTKSILLATMMVSGFTGITSAQYIASAHLNNLSYTNNEFGLSTAKTAYTGSEQFVYDNLGSLKSTYAINDIYFDLDKADIRTDAQQTLDHLAKLLFEETNLKVALTAQTDTRVVEYNKVMNLRRAEAAKAYLVAKGVEQERIVIEKYGRNLVKNVSNEDAKLSLEQQQLNRKVEFNIIYNNVNLAHVSAFNE